MPGAFFIMSAQRTIHNQAGFTLVELILVIAIMGILGAAIAANFSNLLTNASTTGGLGTAGEIQSAINIRYSENVSNNVQPFWPTVLDNSGAGVCTSTHACFDVVVKPVAGGGWSETSPTTYQFNYGGVSQTFTYNPTTGNFYCTAGSC